MKKLMIFTALMFIASFACAETITLTSGKVIDGKITERTDEFIKVDANVGVSVTYYVDEIEKIDENNLLKQSVGYEQENSDSEVKGDEMREEFYPNGTVQYERSFKNGKRHGLTKMFSEDGALWQDVGYVNGEKQGLWKEYYPSGKLKETRIYKDDMVNGIAKRYFEDGKPEREMMWVNNVPDGNIYRKFYEYHSNGKLKQVYAYKNKKLIEHKQFDENSNLIAEKK